MPPRPNENTERPVGLARGTRDWLPGDAASLESLQAMLLGRFARAGYRLLRTPILEPVELHERKSGAGIVSRLFELSDAHQARLCLRPELTAGVVRAFTDIDPPPALPWRVSVAGPVFRFERDPKPGTSREFTQVGVELLGAPGPSADAEVIALAEEAVRTVGLPAPTVRIGHVGLILEVLAGSGLPPSARTALVDSLSEAAAAGEGVDTLETAFDHLAGWLRDAESGPMQPAEETEIGDGQVDRLFRQLVPDVTGRRSGREILGRLRRKWDLARTLHGVVGQARERLRGLSSLKGRAEAVLPRLPDDGPESAGSLRGLVDRLGAFGVGADRIELDLGFGRGIGFYSQMIFELAVATPDGETVVGGGGRYDGLARVLGGRGDVHGVGFALGLERLEHAIRSRVTRGAFEKSRGFLVGINADDPSQVSEAIRLARLIRGEGTEALLDLEETDRHRLVERARALGMGRVVLPGPEILAASDDAGQARRIDDQELARLARQEARQGAEEPR